MRDERLLFVDGLRGIAAVLVMLFHYEVRLSFTMTGGHGYLGVPIFFTLSGFVIAMSIANKTLSLPFLGRFALRRSIRLDIPYWASIAAITLIAIFGARYGANQAVPTLPQLLAHLVYLQDLLGYDAISPVYWTLCYEIQFYLFFVLLLIGMNRARLGQAAQMTIFCVLIVLSLIERGPLEDVMTPGVAFAFWFNFALGALTYWVIAGRADRSVLFGMLAATLLHAALFRDPWALTAALTSSVLYAAGHYGYMQRWLSGSAFQFLGRTSYSLYITHNIFGWYALSIAVRYVHEVIALGIGIVVALLSAWVSYRLIERPSIELSRMVKLESAPRVGLIRVATGPQQ